MGFKEGEYVKIIPRECTSADVKTGMFYGYFGGLCGTVDRIYDDKEVCIKVDLDTLPQDVLKRHTETQESIKKKWLNGLSGEARNRLTPEEKRFQLSYTILVQSTDLEKAKKGDTAEPRPIAIKSVKPLNPPAPSPTEAAVKEEPVPQTEPVAAKPQPAPGAVKVKEKPAAKAQSKSAPRKAAPKSESAAPESNGDLTPAELEFLRQREKAIKGKK